MGRKLVINPCIPKSWNGYEAQLRIADIACRIVVERTADTGLQGKIQLNGNEVTELPFESISRDGDHVVKVFIA